MKHGKEVIAAGDETIAAYLHNWIAYIIQKPGARTLTARILKGIQGAGKNAFTDVLSELFRGYSLPNVMDLSALTGFNSSIEGKVLVVLNEARDVGAEKYQNWDKLKGTITEPTLEIEEKYVQRHTAQNVINLIFTTNSDYPVKIETGDRRYVVLFVDGKYKGKKSDPYWKAFFEERDSADFYNQLFTFYATRDISKFDPSEIPETQAKKDIVNAGKSGLDLIIEQNFQQFKEGIPCQEALNLQPPEYKTQKAFQLALAGKCDRKQVRYNGSRIYKYILKPEFAKFYEKDGYEE
jgi:putative DNA primase/helicase